MKRTNVIFFISIIIIMTSCATTKVKYSGGKNKPIKSITLFSTMIGKVQQPSVPIIQATVFNEKTNSIAGEIMDLQKKYIDNFRIIVANSLKKNFNCEIFSDTSLYSIPEFSELKTKYNFQKNLRINNDNFRYILIASNDINPFQFDNGKIIQYFSNPKNYKQMLSEICNKLKTDLVAVSYSHLTVTGIDNWHGRWGKLRLDTYIYLFNKDGDLVSNEHNWSEPTMIAGTVIEEYKSQLDNLSMIVDHLMIRVASNYKTN